MKLRNKKTGDIGFCKFNIVHSNSNAPLYYHSLREVLEDWEDYEPEEPKEPLIKDEKIRKAVRAWAEAIGLSEETTLFVEKPEFDSNILILSYSLNEIRFNIPIPESMDFCKRYTIAELCGRKNETD